MNKEKIKAVAAFSGGLDSSLAVKIIKEQGIEVVALNFVSPFCQRGGSRGCKSIKDMAIQLGVDFKAVYLGEDYLAMIKDPEYGYGKNMNPCIDCRIFEFRRAKEFMNKIGAKFIITGEVLGQRPMSQHRRALDIIEKESGLEGMILRPLSAKLLPETVAENEGWVNRERLLDIWGRTRKPQMKLAFSLGIKDYFYPAGGCLLTESCFSRRVNDLFEYKEFTINNVELLKLGRHFRISPEFKLIVGRDEEENKILINLAQEGDLCFEPEELPGPTGIGKGSVGQNIKLLAAKIIARYTSKSKEDEVKVTVKSLRQEEGVCLSVRGMEETRLKELMIQ